MLAESLPGLTCCTAAPTPLHHLLYCTSVQSAPKPPHCHPLLALYCTLYLSLSLSSSLRVSSSLLLTAVWLCQGLVIGFSTARSHSRLPEMSDRWWPLVYVPCICCKALIYLIRGTCGGGGGVCRSGM